MCWGQPGCGLLGGIMQRTPVPLLCAGGNSTEIIEGKDGESWPQGFGSSHQPPLPQHIWVIPHWLAML